MKKYIGLLGMTRIPIALFSDIAKQKNSEMNIIEMWLIDAALFIELHDDIKVKGTGLNCEFVLNESLVLQGTYLGQT